MSDNHSHDQNHEQDLSQEYITLVDEEGNEELYQILLTFESENFDKSYVLVYPTSTENDEDVEIFAFSYQESEGGLEGELEDIQTEEEWDMIEEVLGAFMEEEEE
ncbi:MAG TPA: DUF1292 domain-containing protein [Atopostipes sp.]|nr:DUF1292 domain-containing protein [Atopostipes sp.]